MTFEELVADFLGRGFEYLSNDKAGRYVNDAYLVDICEVEDWEFLAATKTGTAPLTISDLRTIEWVLNTTQEEKLKPLDPRHITDDYDVNLATPGTASFYYPTQGSVINVYPANASDSLSVRYWKAPPALSGSEVPLVPERFHSLIVDGAVTRAYEDSDDYELAENAETKFQRRLQKMRESLLTQMRDGPSEYIQVTDESLYY